MALNFSREEIADGVVFTSVTDTRFKTNCIRFNIVTPLMYENASKNALVSYALSKTSRKYPSVTEMNRRLEQLYGASISGDAAKNGDMQIISVSGSCIEDSYTFDGESLTDELCDVLVGCIFEPDVVNGAFNPKTFETNKRELAEEIDAALNDKRTYAVLNASAAIYDGEPARCSALGTKTQANALTSSECCTAYKNLLEKSRIEIFFTGGGNPAPVRKKFSDAFTGVKRNFEGNIRSALSPLKNEIRFAGEKMDVAQCKMVMGFKTPERNIPAIKLMNAIFGATPVSKLFTNVREKQSLCYYCSSRFVESKSVIFVDSGIEQTNLKKAETEIRRQLEMVSNGDFTDEEVENARLYLINSIKSVNDSPSALAGWYFNQTFYDNMRSPEQEIARLKPVKRGDIINAAKSCKLDTVYELTGKEA